MYKNNSANKSEIVTYCLPVHNYNCNKVYHLSIESHFVGVHGPYELHRKEKQISCTASFYKVYRGIAYFNTKMSYLSDFKHTKSKTFRTASTGRMTN